jgi:hypothetical protein
MERVLVTRADPQFVPAVSSLCAADSLTVLLVAMREVFFR